MVLPIEFVELRDVNDFDKVVLKTGYGRFHYEILAVSAMSILSMGFQNGLSSYVFPAAQCDLNFTSYELGILNMAFMVGGIISCFLWGALADNLGRRKILYSTHMADALITMVCAMLPTSTNLLICRFLNGFLIGAPGSIIFTYVAEFQPPKFRSPVVCSCGAFFTLAWLLLPLMAYFVLPLQQISFQFGEVLFMSPWRFFLFVLAIPELLTSLWVMKMPESPKFHLSKGRHEECLNILKQMYARNTGEHPESFPVKYIAAEKVEHVRVDYESSKTMRVLRTMGEQMKSLFMGPLSVVTGLTCTIMFANMFGMFGLGLWLPEIFVRFQKFEEMFPDLTPSIKELSKLTTNETTTCNAVFDLSVTYNTAIIATSSLVFNVICGIVATRLHFKIIPLVTMLIGGAASASIYFLTSSLQNLVVASLFQASMITANMTIGSIAVELFPTSVVGIALCLVMCSGRLGAMASSYLFGYFMDSQCEIPIFVVGAIVFLGGVLCFFVPRKSKTVVMEHNIEISVLSGRDLKLIN